MRILSVGSLSGISNTCRFRNEALKNIAIVDEVNTHTRNMSLYERVVYHLFLLGLPIGMPEDNKENDKIRTLIDTYHYDVVWIDKGWTIAPDTLRYIKSKQPDCKLISYSPDNMALRHNQSQQYLKCIPLYDLHITTKSYILEDMRQLGARRVEFVPKTYSAIFHFPRELSDDDVERIGGDVGFIGAWEKERCDSVCFLADNGICVRVWGDGRWNDYKNYSPNLTIEGRGLFNEDYSKAFKAFKISLCFLRKKNFDQQTSRTMEIPASGGFMLAERTAEHQMLFMEGREAEYFSTNEELLNKCRYYLQHDAERQQIAEAGTARCKLSDYSNEGMVKKVIEMINK